ncbi:MAG: FtsW/RodA/SpoVE family cell cycle protein [Gammaproteobacteria bacterium]
MRNNAPMLDATVPAACLLLFGAGLAAMYSVSLAQNTGWAGKQLLWAVLSAAAGGAVLACSLSSLRRFACPLMLAVIAALAASFFFEPRNGAQRWIAVGAWSLQPSEFCKWAALLLAAHYASRPQYRRRQTAFVLPIAAWLCLPLGLIALQPDFGALLLISFVALAVLFLSGLSLRWVIALCVLLVVAAVFLAWAEPYRMQRLGSFIDPFQSEDGGYNQKHALIAFTLGGFWGAGIMRGIQQWGYLPEPHNDFIIAIIGEELGLTGFLAVCALFFYIVQRAVAIGGAAEKRGEIFGALYAYGCASMLGAQALINIGGNVSLLPFKGFTLPLVSYGGSSLLATGLMLGTLMRVDYENRQDSLQSKEARP